MLSDDELADMEQAARESTTFPWIRGYLLALVAEVRRLRAENDALREQVAAQQAGANADRAAAVELLGRRAGKPLAWSEKLPAGQGWYWWRADDESPTVVEWVYDDYRGGPRLVVWVEAGEAPTVQEQGGNWAGPIPVPAC